MKIAGNIMVTWGQSSRVPDADTKIVRIRHPRAR